MSDREALLAAIRQFPDDDAPRLVFADWLQERDEHDRAELIRVQVARARLSPRPVLRALEWQTRPSTGDGIHFQFTVLPEEARRVGLFESDPNKRPVTFDVIVRRWGGANKETEEIAYDCVLRQFNMLPPGNGLRVVELSTVVTGIPCPVRPEADALDGRAAALMLKIPFGDFCPSTFSWFVDAETFERSALNGDTAEGGDFVADSAVLVRRGFAEHVRCSWEDWVRWADWFRANHPCERVTLTTVPQWEFHYDGITPTVTATWKGGGRKAKCELPAEFLRGVQVYSRVERVTHEFCREQWPGTSFALPGQYHEMSFAPLAPLS